MMRRVIEDLIEKRKNRQVKMQETLSQLGQLLENTGFFFNKKKRGLITAKLLEFNDDLNHLVTAQDKEWDAYSNNHSTGVFKSLQWKIEKMEAEYANVKTLLVNFITLEKSLDRLIQSIPQPQESQPASGSGDIKTQLLDIKEQLSTYRYADFEQRFRGDEEQVKDKLKKYLPYFNQADNILDIGCGRGEFLELLKDAGKTAQGIDLSVSMLQLAQEKGLACQKTDALQFLKNTPADSLGGIFSAQVIEHLTPEYLRDIVQEAFRTLQKGSPILLETVNPLSLFALSNIYFLDVTHQKPLHPEYMRYLLESSGFDRVGIVFSEELAEERLAEIAVDTPGAREFNTNVDKLNKLLYSSPVYAVTGIKL